MKIAFSVLITLAAATLLPATAATKVATYEQAQARLTDDGYLLFIYGQGWDKRAQSITTELYNNPQIAKAAGSAAMILVGYPEGTDEKRKPILEKTMLWYRENGYQKERLGMTIDRLGIEKLEEALFSDDILNRKDEILGK
jgi:dissimilatory sulfite reductase (desulfoviridin) alpha/beta subunit